MCEPEIRCASSLCSSREENLRYKFLFWWRCLQPGIYSMHNYVSHIRRRLYCGMIMFCHATYGFWNKEIYTTWLPLRFLCIEFWNKKDTHACYASIDPVASSPNLEIKIEHSNIFKSVSIILWGSYYAASRRAFFLNNIACILTWIDLEWTWIDLEWLWMHLDECECFLKQMYSRITLQQM